MAVEDDRCGQTNGLQPSLDAIFLGSAPLHEETLTSSVSLCETVRHDNVAPMTHIQRAVTVITLVSVITLENSRIAS